MLDRILRRRKAVPWPRTPSCGEPARRRSRPGILPRPRLLPSRSDPPQSSPLRAAAAGPPPRSPRTVYGSPPGPGASAAPGRHPRRPISGRPRQRPSGRAAAGRGRHARGPMTAMSSRPGLVPARAAKTWQSWVRAHGDPARLLLDQMVAVGAVRISDGEDGDLARLTPLGLAAIRTQFADSEVEVPLLPPAEEITAADLIAMAAGAAEEEFQAETAAWLAHRTKESAARELLSVAAESDPASRVLAVAMVTGLGAPAEPAWRDVLGQMELRGYAKATLATLAGGDPATAMSSGLELADDDLAWVFTDALVADGWDDVDDDVEYEPAALAKRLGEMIPAGRAPAAFEMMARAPHPDAASVLTVIGRHHPDKKIAKAARKSAYKAASRQV